MYSKLPCDHHLRAPGLQREQSLAKQDFEEVSCLPALLSCPLLVVCALLAVIGVINVTVVTIDGHVGCRRRSESAW